MHRRIKTKMILDKDGDEIEQVFEKQHFLCVVTTYFLQNCLKKDYSCLCEHVFQKMSLKKKPCLHVSTYFVGKVFETQPFSCVTTMCLNTFLKYKHVYIKPHKQTCPANRRVDYIDHRQASAHGVLASPRVALCRVRPLLPARPHRNHVWYRSNCKTGGHGALGRCRLE